jgi:hypothetical protein
MKQVIWIFLAAVCHTCFAVVANLDDNELPQRLRRVSGLRLHRDPFPLEEEAFWGRQIDQSMSFTLDPSNAPSSSLTNFTTSPTLSPSIATTTATEDPTQSPQLQTNSPSDDPTNVPTTNNPTESTQVPTNIDMTSFTPSTSSTSTPTTSSPTISSISVTPVLSWDPLGQAVEGGMVDLSADGRRMVVASNNEKVSVYFYHVLQGEWQKIGDDILAPELETGDSFLIIRSIAISGDGNRVAVATQSGTGELETRSGESRGKIQIFHWDLASTSWLQVGSSLDGDPLDELGYSVSLSWDGSRIAAGAPSATYREGPGCKCCLSTLYL